MRVSFVRRVLLVCVGWASAFGQDRPHLAFAGPIQLLECKPVTSVPCFSASFNVVDNNFVPVGVDFPKGDRLLSDLTLTADNMPVKVFYAVTGSSQRSVRRRVTLVLVDISGSMAKRLPTGETRFEAAKSALTGQFLETFQDGVDEVAIVPFESHDVGATIRSASFANTKQEAYDQVQKIPAPAKRNNTALYSAVDIGLDVLKERVRALKNSGAAPAQAILVVMTDGKNEVYARDDQGLLKGPEGLDAVAKKRSDSQTQVIGIGFGKPGEIDLEALRRISSDPPFISTDADSLQHAFNVARKLSLDRLEVYFLSPWPDRASLAGRSSIAFTASLLFPDGLSLKSNEAVFIPPNEGFPVPQDIAPEQVRTALNKQITASQTDWLTLLRPVFVFLGFGALLIVAWFWIPRLMWPGQYVGRLAYAKPTRRWTGPSGTVQRPTRPLGNSAPRGFEHGEAGFQGRTPQDATIVRPPTGESKDRRGRGFGSED